MLTNERAFIKIRAAEFELRKLCAIHFLRRFRPIAFFLLMACGISFSPGAFASASFVQAVANKASGSGQLFVRFFPQ